jgi:hypothetical protein
MRITIVKGADGEQVSEFDEQAIVLGREGTLKLTDRTVSKRHARLRRDGNHWYVEDMGSRNGTFINNTRVIEPRAVSDGDRLKIGSTIMVVSELNGPGGERHVGPAPKAIPSATVAPAEPTQTAPVTPDFSQFETSHAHSVGLLDDAGPAASEYDEPHRPAYASVPEFLDVTGVDPSPSAAAEPVEATTATFLIPESTSFAAADVSSVPRAIPTEIAAPAAGVEPDKLTSPPHPPATEDPPRATAEVEQPAPAEESMNPWLSDLPAKRRSSQALRSVNDEAILFSIRPLAQHDEATTPAWRRMLPYSILVLVLFVVAANLVLIALFRREARRDAHELRQALARQDQATANLIVQELREELREPSPHQLQAMQDLGDGLIAKQTNVAEKLQAELAAHREFIKQEAARKEPAATRDADAAQAALLHELAEIKQSIAGLQKVPSAQTGPTPSQPSASTEPGEGATPVPAAEQTTAPVEPAAPAVAAAAATITAVNPEAKSASTTFVIDASGALQHSIRAAVDEVRRIVEAGRLSTSSRVLLLYQGRLFELPPSTLDRAADPADPVDRGPADLATTVKVALENRPPALHLLSDTLGDPGATLKVIRAADTSGTSIHVTQFYSRDHRDQLKALARDFHGNYSYIAQR